MPKACPVCGSRRWRKDGVTGNAVCEEGHVFQDFRAENLVTEPGAGVMLQKRRMRKGPRRNRRKEDGRVNAEYYQDADAEWLKLEALQLLLRLQVRALKELWGLPDVFEMIVRDLWAYQLAISPRTTPSDGMGAGEGDRTFLPDFGDHEKTDKTDHDETDALHVAASDVGSVRSSSPSSGSSRSHGAQGGRDRDGIDPELLAMLSERSESDKEEREREELREAQQNHPQSRGWRRRRRLRIGDTVVTLVMGLWMLRVPVMLVDVGRLINDNDLPFLDFGYTNLIPSDMRRRMNREVVLALSPSRASRPLAMFDECRQFARALSRHFGISLPQFNAPPLVWRTISSLGGTPTTYAQVIRLLGLIDLNLALVERSIETFTRKGRTRRGSGMRGAGSMSETASPAREREREGEQRDSEERDEADSFGRSRSRSRARSDRLAARVELYEKTTRYRDVVLPELAVAAGWVVVMKMMYGLDGRERHVLLRNEPALGMPEGRPWLEALSERVKNGSLRGHNGDLVKQDFLHMDTDGLDRFLDKAAQVLLRDRDFARDTDIFPLAASSGARTDPLASWSGFHTTFIQPSHVSTDMANKALPLMPGERIRSYDASDVTGTLPRDYEAVIQAAAMVVGVAVEDVGRIVEVFEARLEGIGKERSRSQSRERERRGRITRETLRKRRSLG